jgi:hypothetical protein
MDAKAFTLNFKLGQAVLGKEREEIAQLVHRKLRFRTARLVLLVASSPAITVARHTCSLRLS